MYLFIKNWIGLLLSLQNMDATSYGSHNCDILFEMKDYLIEENLDGQGYNFF